LSNRHRVIGRDHLAVLLPSRRWCCSGNTA